MQSSTLNIRTINYINLHFPWTATDDCLLSVALLPIGFFRSLFPSIQARRLKESRTQWPKPSAFWRRHWRQVEAVHNKKSSQNTVHTQVKDKHNLLTFNKNIKRSSAYTVPTMRKQRWTSLYVCSKINKQKLKWHYLNKVIGNKTEEEKIMTSNTPTFKPFMHSIIACSKKWN